MAAALLSGFCQAVFRCGGYPAQTKPPRRQLLPGKGSALSLKQKMATIRASPTFWLLLVALLLPPSACQTPRLGSVTEVSLSLRLVGLKHITGSARGVRSIGHRSIITVRAGVVVIIRIHLVGASQSLPNLLFGLTLGRRCRRLIVVTPLLPLPLSFSSLA